MVTYAPRDEPNPWSEENWSLTEQGRFIRRMVAEHGPRHGMDRVKQFAAQAGVVVNDSGVVIKRPPLDR